ncbi:MAG: single-stranded-DNA-specific exonuclease RecJ, partial [Oscillospiraceae bacterium]
MKYQQWNLRPGDAGARRRLEEAGLPPLCAAVLSARGIGGPEDAARFLASGPERFHDPYLLRDMDRAADRVRRAV